MKRAFVLILLICLVSGCNSPLSLPEIDQDKVLVTHVKEPLLTVIDVAKQDVIHQEEFNFSLNSLVKIDNKLVVAGISEKEVLLIDLHNGNIRPLISAIASITDLYYDQTEQLLFMTDAEHNEVLLFDLKKEEIIERIKVGSHPNAIALNKPFLYVLNGNEASVSIIDLATYKVTKTFPVVQNPTDIVAKDENIWVGGHGSYGELNKYVYVYYASTGELKKKIKTGSMPVALYTDEYSDELFVLSHGSNDLHVLDTKDLNVKRKVTTGENPYYLTGDKNYIYVTALDGDNIIMINRHSFEVSQEYTLDAGPYGIVLGGNKDE